MEPKAQAPRRFAVVGHPVAHSRSPAIHAAFARELGLAITYDRLLAPLDGFRETVQRFHREGGSGLNVTLPFKIEAHALSDRLTERAKAAGAVNTLRFDADGILGDNTDGIGLVNDLTGRLGLALAGSSVLLLGAGGAARGAILPLLQAGVAKLAIRNRTAGRARELAASFGDSRIQPQPAVGGRFDLVINATSSGVSDECPELHRVEMDGAHLAYDMFYRAGDTAFMAAARELGCRAVSDGLGMLVEQAAESFLLWTGQRPRTAPVHQRLRAEIDSSARLSDGAHGTAVRAR